MWLVATAFGQHRFYSGASGQVLILRQSRDLRLKDNPTEDRLTSVSSDPQVLTSLEHHLKKRKEEITKGELRTLLYWLLYSIQAFLKIIFRPLLLLNIRRPRSWNSASENPTGFCLEHPLHHPGTCPESRKHLRPIFFWSFNSERAECWSHPAGAERVCRERYWRNPKTPEPAISLIWGWQGLQAELMAQL